MSSFITSLLMPIYIFLGMASPIAVGTSVTTINGSDTLSASRTVINDNFTALNNGKIENSTTSLPLLTSASGLATVGTITSGTWNATAIGVAKGGTGTTSPTSNQVLLGNGSSGIKVVSGLGTSGQFLTSNGAGSAPTWQSASVDQTSAYTWTGLHTYNTGGVINNASSTFTARVQIPANASNNLNLNNLDYAFPTSRGTSSSVLAENGSGTLSFLQPVWYFVASDDLKQSADNEETLISTDANYAKYKDITIRRGGTIRVKFDLKTGGAGGNHMYGKIYINGVAVGTERDSTSGTYATYSEDISVEPYDEVQLYLKLASADNGYARNFRLYWMTNNADESTVNTD